MKLFILYVIYRIHLRLSFCTSVRCKCESAVLKELKNHVSKHTQSPSEGPVSGIDSNSPQATTLITCTFGYINFAKTGDQRQHIKHAFVSNSKRVIVMLLQLVSSIYELCTKMFFL